MNLIYKLIKKDPSSREGIVEATSILGIVVNICIAAVKVLLGLFTNSIAIISEGINNAADVLTSLLTLLGNKLAHKHPDAKHPFGYGRIEYLTSLIVSTLIIVTGVELLISSVKLVIHPEELNISIISLLIVAVSAIVKFLLGAYTIKKGNEAESTALVAVGVECRNDSFVSVVTIISSLVYLLFDVSIDAYAGMITSAVIIKAGGEILLETISEIIGRPGKKELATKLLKEIRATDGIVNAADMTLHNYGPDAWSGSVNVEMDHKKTVGEVYDILHRLQLHIMHDYDVTMVFGIYAVDNDSEETKILRTKIADYVKKKEHVNSYHAVFIDHENKKIYVDFIVDYDLKDWEALRDDFLGYMKQEYPDFEIMLTIETDYV